MIEINTEPTPKEIRVFGLLWLLFFAGICLVAWWKPEGLIGAGMILGAAWIISLLFNPADKKSQLLGIIFPALFSATGWSIKSGVPLQTVLSVVGGIGVVGALAVWIAPALGRRLYVGWMYAALPVGWTISNIILAAVYYVVLTPIGLLMRMFGHDPMDRELDSEATTYWIERKPVTDPARYFRQF